MPSPGTIKYINVGGDGGVEVKGTKLKVTNLELAFQSGRHMYLINYAQAISLLLGKKLDLTSIDMF